MTREEFLAERRTGIGGSDVGSLFNIAPYGCSRALYYDKTGTIPDYPQKESPDMRRGILLEDIACNEWQLQNPGWVIVKSPVQRHRNHPWALVHIDRWLFHSEDQVEEGRENPTSGKVVEVKCPSREMFYRIRKEGLPEAYILQAQWAMWITGARRCKFIVFCADLWDYLDFDVEASDMHYLFALCGDAFWKQVQGGEPPKKLPPNSKQCQRCQWRTSCQGDALLPAVEDPKDTIPFLPDLAPVLNEWPATAELLSEADDLHSAAAEKVRELLGPVQAADAPGFRVYFRKQERKTGEFERLWLAFHCLLQNAPDSVEIRKALSHHLGRIPESLKDVEMREFQKKGTARPLRIYAR